MKNYLNYIVKTKTKKPHINSGLNGIFKLLLGKTHNMGSVPRANAYP